MVSSLRRDINTFMAYFQQYGGWWKTTDGRVVPDTADLFNRNMDAAESEFVGDGESSLCRCLADPC